jgi:hypothetical protein
MQGPARPRLPRCLTVPPLPTLLPSVTRACAATRRPLRAVSPTACYPLLHERASTRMRRSSPSRRRCLAYPCLSRTLARPPSRSALHANVPVPFVPSHPSCPPATRASLLHECASTHRRPLSPSHRLAHLVPPLLRERASTRTRPSSPSWRQRLAHPHLSRTLAYPPSRSVLCTHVPVPPCAVSPTLAPHIHVLPRPPATSAQACARPLCAVSPTPVPPSPCLPCSPSPLTHLARPPSPTPCRMRSPRPLRAGSPIHPHLSPTLHDHPHAISRPSRPPPVAQAHAHPGAPFAACSPIQPLPLPTWHDHPHAVSAHEHARHHPAAHSRPTMYQRTAMLLHCSRAVYYCAIPISILIHILFVLFCFL